jgi:hypothetical protein
MGILGVTHMMMLDKKNLEIADVIYNWIGKNVPTSRNRQSGRLKPAPTYATLSMRNTR